MARIRIGTSGWHYKHWRGPYYPEKFPTAKMLEFYMADFDSVEINNSFYRLPTVNALQTWRDLTPPRFCFAVKASRFLTHMKKLKDPEEGFRRFFPLIRILGEKLGPILFQLPPRWTCNPTRLAEFLSALPGEHRYTFELRDPSWHVAEVYALLEKYNAAFCMYELAGFQSPLQVTADFTYIRLHGPGNKYQGDYSRKSLDAWAKRIRKWDAHLAGVYVYFDNDQAGYAVKNAKELKQRLNC
jgi:uncharacterized protein YecE (DUF72 family)